MCRLQEREESLRLSTAHSGYSVCGRRLRPGSEICAPPVAVVRASDLRSPGRRLRLYRSVGRTAHLCHHVIAGPPAGGLSRLRSFARGPAAVGRYAGGAAPERVESDEIRETLSASTEGVRICLRCSPSNPRLQPTGPRLALHYSVVPSGRRTQLPWGGLGGRVPAAEAQSVKPRVSARR